MCVYNIHCICICIYVFKSVYIKYMCVLNIVKIYFFSLFFGYILFSSSMLYFTFNFIILLFI